jgi:hypothetical protein
VRAGAEVPSATGVPRPIHSPTPPPTISPDDVNNSMSMPLAHPDLPSGELDLVQLVSLIEDVSALRSAIAISRAREESLVARVEALEALVTTLRDSDLAPLAPTSMKRKPTVHEGLSVLGEPKV